MPVQALREKLRAVTQAGDISSVTTTTSNLSVEEISTLLPNINNTNLTSENSKTTESVKIDDNRNKDMKPPMLSTTSTTIQSLRERLARIKQSASVSEHSKTSTGTSEQQQ
jgi:hypothetical protein